MTERPMLFSAPMVRALLAGTKTQTRRVVKPQPAADARFADGWKIAGRGGHESAVSSPLVSDHCPYGVPGDRLWVRETWMPDPPIDDTWASTAWSGCGRVVSEIPARFHHPRFCNYAADWLHGPIRWRPSIHMPRWASRITLEVTGVRVERLQAISEADAIAEGVEPWVVGAGWRDYSLTPDQEEVGAPPMPSARDSYHTLWKSINGPGSWDANPWVWVVQFKPSRPEGGTMQEKR